MRFILALLATTAVPLAASAAVISDASFENAVQGSGGFQYSPPGSAWTFTQSGVASNGSPWYSGSAPDGVQAAFLQSYAGTIGVISQTISGLTVGTTYRFSFYEAARPTYGANAVTVSFAGQSLGTTTPGSTSFAQVLTSSFVAAGTSGLLAFTGASTQADLDAAIDNVTIVQPRSETADVPEPMSIALLAIGLVGTIAAGRKRV